MLHRHQVSEARRHRLACESIYSANAPFHLAENTGLSFYRDFLTRMDSIINPTVPGSPDAAEDAAWGKVAARAGE